MYPLPLLVTITETMLPLLMTGMRVASSPLLNEIFGCLLKLMISEEPYPTPEEVRSIDSIEPLKIG